MSTKQALIIEPDCDLAQALRDLLESWKFNVTACATHRFAAAAAIALNRVDLLAACVPASDDDRSGPYLADRRMHQDEDLPTVLMLADPLAMDGSEPLDAVPLVKPFAREAFRKAINDAGCELP